MFIWYIYNFGNIFLVTYNKVSYYILTNVQQTLVE